MTWQRKFLGRKVHVGFWQDYQNAVDMASYFRGPVDTTNAFLNFLLLRTRDLIEDRWWAVEAVAAALAERRHMTYAEVVSAINQAASVRDF